MKAIDLIDARYSEVEYDIFKFNDGEPHIKIISEIDHKQEYSIITRIRTTDDLFIVLQVGDILERHGVDYKLYLTYLMGMRMDRVMTFNEAFSLKLVTDMLKTIHPKQIYVFEPHSHKTLELLNAKEFSMLEYDNTYSRFIDDIIDNNHVLKCFPDNGAYKRYKDFISNTNSNYVILDKKRDISNGNIVGMKVSSTFTNPVNLPYDRIIIIDDLCDGGRTFIEAKKLLNEEYPDIPIDIFVKHMVNKNGLNNLMNNFNHVYITNSFDNYSRKSLEFDKWDNLKLTIFDSHIPNRYY